MVVVPDGWKPTERQGAVVVALDDSGECGAAIEFAVAIASERRARVRMVHVWDLPNVFGWDAVNSAGISAEWAQSRQQHVEAIAEQWRLKYPELEIVTYVVQGHAVEGVLTAAADQADAQLIVIGGHRRRPASAVLLGSVARGVLQHAICPVAVVRQRRDA